MSVKVDIGRVAELHLGAPHEPSDFVEAAIARAAREFIARSIAVPRISSRTMPLLGGVTFGEAFDAACDVDAEYRYKMLGGKS